MTLRLAIFDCDGTLSDGQAAVCAAMETAFAAADLPAPDRHQVRRIVGLSLPQAVRRLAPAASADQHAAAVDSYKAAFREARLRGAVHEPLFEGIPELLRDLNARGWALAVATGKSDRGLAATLSAHGLTDLFSSLQTADRHPSKPHPSMVEQCLADTGAAAGDAVVIGDTVFDMEMAMNAGAAAIGVDWGYHEAAELRAAGARAVARDCAELKELLDAL